MVITSKIFACMDQRHGHRQLQWKGKIRIFELRTYNHTGDFCRSRTKHMCQILKCGQELKDALKKLTTYWRWQEVKISSSLDMSTAKQVHWPTISCREVWRGQGREGAQENWHSNITEWTGKNTAETVQIMVDRSKWRRIMAEPSTVVLRPDNWLWDWRSWGNYGHAMRRDEGHVLRRMLDAPVPGKRRRGRQKTRWNDSCKREKR